MSDATISAASLGLGCSSTDHTLPVAAIAVPGGSAGGGSGSHRGRHSQAGGSGKADAVIGLGAPKPRSADANGPAPPMWLFVGSEDLDTGPMVERMREQGYDAQGVVLPGVTHEGITDPAQAPEIVDLIFEAIDSL